MFALDSGALLAFGFLIVFALVVIVLLRILPESVRLAASRREKVESEKKQRALEMESGIEFGEVKIKICPPVTGTKGDLGDDGRSGSDGDGSSD